MSGAANATASSEAFAEEPSTLGFWKRLFKHTEVNALFREDLMEKQIPEEVCDTHFIQQVHTLEEYGGLEALITKFGNSMFTWIHSSLPASEEYQQQRKKQIRKLSEIQNLAWVDEDEGENGTGFGRLKFTHQMMFKNVSSKTLVTAEDILKAFSSSKWIQDDARIEAVVNHIGYRVAERGLRFTDITLTATWTYHPKDVIDQLENIGSALASKMLKRCDSPSAIVNLTITAGFTNSTTTISFDMIKVNRSPILKDAIRSGFKLGCFCFQQQECLKMKLVSNSLRKKCLDMIKTDDLSFGQIIIKDVCYSTANPFKCIISVSLRTDPYDLTPL